MFEKYRTGDEDGWGEEGRGDDAGLEMMMLEMEGEEEEEGRMLETEEEGEGERMLRKEAT